ncbi:hypothetical protein J6590_070929 [Homalodisca vitripennis]|nr:hypothetical protein J6590_070929 [Homalodisca vitripennis]
MSDSSLVSTPCHTSQFHHTSQSLLTTVNLKNKTKYEYNAHIILDNPPVPPKLLGCLQD